jgi:hypothetical protein
MLAIWAAISYRIVLFVSIYLALIADRVQKNKMQHRII